METNHNFLHAASQPVSDRMRELLARAAQDHVYEQRSQGQILDEIRQRLEGMEWLLREVRERELNGLTGQLDGVRGQVDELAGKPPEWAESLAEHIEAVGERVKPVTELPALWADVGVIAENVDEGLSRLHAVMDTAQHLTEATRQATERMEGMAKRLDKLQGSMEATAVRFNRLDKSLAELGHRAEKLEHSFGAVTTRVDQSLADVGDRVEHGIQTINGRLEGVSGRLDGLDGRLEGLDISALHRHMAELSDRPYIDPSARFDSLEKRLAEGVDPLVDELRARPDRDEVEDTVSRIVAAAYDEMSKRLDEVAAGFDVINDDLRGRVETVQGDVGKQIAGALADFTKRVDMVQDDLTRRVTDAHTDVSRHVREVREDVTRKIDGVTGDVARRVDIIHEDVWKRIESVHEEFSRRAESIHDEVGKKVDGVHEDVLKRLATLEETMLALAEALLRPRRDGKD